jgi:hypothetical protein
MADAMQGIMSLGAGAPEGAPPSPTPEIPPEALQGFSMAQQATGDPRQTTKDMMDSMQEADPELVLQFRQMLASIDVPDELLDAMGKMVDTIMAEPQRYAEIRENFIKEGVPEELLPPEFDPAYFMAFNLALDEIADSKAPVTQNFAQGGIATLNPVMKGIASMGRNQDTQLAHIMPSEARMLRRYGGSGTMNPRTGLPEFFIGKVFKAVGKAFKSATKAVTGAVKGVIKGVTGAIKSITSSTIGRMVLTIGATMILGPMIAPYLATVGLAGAATGITAGLVSTGISLATGASLKDSLKQGLIAGVTAQAFQYGSDKLGFSAPKPGQPGAPVVDKSYVNVGGKDINAAEFIDDAGGSAVMGKVPEQPFMPRSSELTSSTALQNADDVYAKGLVTPREPLLTQAESIAKAQAGANAPLSNADVIAKAQAGMTPSSASDAGQGFINKGAAYDLARTSPGDAAKYSLSGNVASGGSAPSASLYDTVANKVSNAYQGTKDIYNQYLSPSGIQAQGAEAAQSKAVEAYNNALMNGAPKDLANQIAKDTYNANLPGMMATYGPLAAAGTAAAYGLGAFEGQPAEKPELPTLGSDLFAANPQAYLATPGGVRTQYYGGVQGAQYGAQGMKAGGIADLPTKFPRKNGPINGPGTGTSDDIPAMLSDGEFVFTAKAVRNIGGGSRRLGAKRMYTMMKALEKRSA